jgi:hypothetical protein
MTSRRLLLALTLLTSVLLPFAVAGEEVLRLQSGREVPLSDGTLRSGEAQTLLQEAEDFLKQGRLDLARDNCQAIRAKGNGVFVPEITSLLARIEEVERSSFVVLRNGQLYKGKLQGTLRSDHLGIQGRRDIPLWSIKRIEAEYFINYSQVTKTYYVLTLLEVQFRDASSARARITEEVVLQVEEEGGTVRKAVVGYPYVLLHKRGMSQKFPQMIQDRVSKIVVYPALYEGETPLPREQR